MTGILAVLLPLVHASPPDPTWIAGLDDNAYYDGGVAPAERWSSRESQDPMSLAELFGA